LVADAHVPDDVYESARSEFSEQELVELTTALVAINGWNRLLIAFRVPPAVARNN
jgi:alkylhydroperoxidase family enzyme